MNMSRGLEQFAQGLSTVFQHMAKALKLGSPLVFTYHHNKLEAYLPVAVAILDSNLVCTASIPCPAEMGASIHIKGTKSSTIDTIFVCRSCVFTPNKLNTMSVQEIAYLVDEDINNLRRGKVKLTHGDLKCLIYGHLTRLAIWFLKNDWNKDCPIQERLAIVKTWIEGTGSLAAIEQYLEKNICISEKKQQNTVTHDEISF